MLPSSAEVEEVYLNPTSGIMRGLQDHSASASSDTTTLCIDSTTLNVTCASSVASKLKKEIAGAEMLDAPVSGGKFILSSPSLKKLMIWKLILDCFPSPSFQSGVVGAREGSLTFMCGGTEATFSQAQPVLRVMGKKMIYCGPSGSGLAAKLTNK